MLIQCTEIHSKLGRDSGEPIFIPKTPFSLAFLPTQEVDYFYNSIWLWLLVRPRTCGRFKSKNEPNSKPPFLQKLAAKIFQFPLFSAFYHLGVLCASVANQKQKTGKRTQFRKHLRFTK